MKSDEEKRNNEIHKLFGKINALLAESDRGNILYCEDQDLNKALTSLKVVFFRFDHSINRYCLITPNCREILGIRQDKFYDIAIKDLVKVVHPDDREKIINLEGTIRRSLQKAPDGLITLEFRLRRKRKYRWILARFKTSLTTDGKLKYSTGVYSDITQARRIMQLANGTTDWELPILEAIPDIIFRFTKTGKLIGYKPSEDIPEVMSWGNFLGRWYDEIFNKETCATLDKIFAAVLETGEVEILEFTWDIEGETRFFEARMSPCGKDGDVICIVRDITEHKKYRETIERSNDQLETEVRQRTGELRDLHNKLLNVSEAERRKLAMELHDSVAQDLVVLQMLSSQADKNERDANWVHTINKLSTKLIKEIRRICEGLYPTVLESLGLYHALKSLEEFYAAAGMKVELRWGLENDGLRLEPETEIALFRIVQEALSNSLKHGQSKNVRVEICYSTKTKAKIVLTVRDDGIGLGNAKKVEFGFGLQTMKDRAISLGGTFEFLNMPKGAGLRVTVPTGKKIISAEWLKACRDMEMPAEK